MALRTRNILSLCAGVGGLELGIALALHHRGEAARGICYVEREGAAAASLVASMEAGWLHPAPVWSNMLTFDARPWRGLVHILASGDPCQDNSVAGKRAGSSGKRFLAPEVVRVAAECRPDLIFRENVPGNLGEQLDALAPPLERLGYRVAAGIFSSAETGNTMRRERGFVLAERVDEGRRSSTGANGPEQQGLGKQGEARRGECSGPAIGRSELVRCGLDGQPLGIAVEPAIRDGGHGPDARTASGVQGEGDERQRLRPSVEQPSADLGERLACAGSTGPQGHELGCPLGSQQRVTASRSASELRGTRFPPAIIPRPTDTGRWIDVLDRWPELQPALSEEEAQSHLRRGIDAMAQRVERLRATGNGVDPVVAAYAFLSLGTLLEASGSAGRTLLTTAEVWPTPIGRAAA